MAELVDNSIKMVIIIVFYVLKKVKIKQVN